MVQKIVSTRKKQVLDRLSASLRQWVDGPDLANERVGGSEGHRRIRELRAAGHQIEQRRHPNPERRGVFQYRLTSLDRLDANGATVPNDGAIVVSWQREWTCETCGSEPLDRPMRLQGDFAIARCGTCRARRYFRSLAA